MCCKQNDEEEREKKTTTCKLSFAPTAVFCHEQVSEHINCIAQLVLVGTLPDLPHVASLIQRSKSGPNIMEQNMWKSFVHRLQLTVDNIIYWNSTHYLIVNAPLLSTCFVLGSFINQTFWVCVIGLLIIVIHQNFNINAGEILRGDISVDSLVRKTDICLLNILLNNFNCSMSHTNILT